MRNADLIIKSSTKEGHFGVTEFQLYFETVINHFIVVY